MVLNLAIALAASLCVSWFAWQKGYLTRNAALASTGFGIVILLGAGLPAAISVVVCFFITGWLSRKRDHFLQDGIEHTRTCRNLRQVVANALTLSVLAVCYGLDNEKNMATIAAFLGCVGAVAGDTWATEISPFNKQQPHLITSFKHVDAGTPGAVTVLGTAMTGLAGLVAAMVYILSMAMVLPITSLSLIVTLSCSAIIGGLVGALTDSVLGARFQAVYRDAEDNIVDKPVNHQGVENEYINGYRWLSNNLVNFSNSVAGATSAYLIWLLIDTSMLS